MKLLFNLSSVIALGLFFSCQPPPPKPAPAEPTHDAWRVYTSPDKTFSVELPCEPTQRNVSAESTPIYEYGCAIEQSESLTAYTISVMTVDVGRPETRDEAAFERELLKLFDPHKRVVKITPIKIDGGIGREMIVTNTRDEMDNLRGRVIIVGTHRFEFGCVATDIKLLESPEVNRFLASFKPLK